MAVKKTVKTEMLKPLETLEAHIAALDAAMLVAVTETEVNVVHTLRTSTRRVEAHLRLLDLSETKTRRLPKHEDEANAVHQHLRKVRRAAGAVRDLDVQMDLIWHDAPAKDAVHDGSPGDAVRREAKTLRRHLKNTRKIEADKLIAVLSAQQGKVDASLRALEQVLKPALAETISGASFERDIHAWFAAVSERTLDAKHHVFTGDADKLKLAVEHLDTDALHAVRKAAKLCRYMAEGGQEDSPLQVAAQQFEAVQQAGGEWHDWLLLTRLARGFHGRKSELALRYKNHRDAALAEYHLRLVELLPVLTEPVKNVTGKSSLS